METERTLKQRPIGIWLIVGFFALSYCLAIPSFVFSVSNHPGIFEQLSIFEITVSIISMAGTLVALVYLVKLRVVSLWIFLMVGLISVIPIAERFFSGRALPIPENMGYGGKIFEVVVWAVILFYLWTLKLNGTLK